MPTGVKPPELRATVEQIKLIANKTQLGSASSKPVKLRRTAGSKSSSSSFRDSLIHVLSSSFAHFLSTRSLFFVQLQLDPHLSSTITRVFFIPQCPLIKRQRHVDSAPTSPRPVPSSQTLQTLSIDEMPVGSGGRRGFSFSGATHQRNPELVNDEQTRGSSFVERIKQEEGDTKGPGSVPGSPRSRLGSSERAVVGSGGFGGGFGGFSPEVEKGASPRSPRNRALASKARAVRSRPQENGKQGRETSMRNRPGAAEAHESENTRFSTKTDEYPGKAGQQARAEGNGRSMSKALEAPQATVLESSERPMDGGHVAAKAHESEVERAGLEQEMVKRLVTAEIIATSSSSQIEFLAGDVNGRFLSHSKDLSDVRAELSGVRKELRNSRTQGNQELTEVWAELTDVRMELQNSQAREGSARTELADARTELADVRAQLSGCRKEAGLARAEVTTLRTELAAARMEITEVRTELRQMQVSRPVFGCRPGLISRPVMGKQHTVAPATCCSITISDNFVPVRNTDVDLGVQLRVDADPLEFCCCTLCAPKDPLAQGAQL